MDFRRVAGFAGLTFAASVLLLNGLRVASGRPLGGATMSEITAYLVEHGDILRLASIIAPLPMISLPVFAAGVLISTRDAAGRVNGWAVAGVAGAVMNTSVFAGVLATDAILGARSSTLDLVPQYTQVLWDLNLVSFALAIGAVGLTLGGLGFAVLTSGTSIGLGRLSVVGAVFLLAGAVQSQAALQGSPTFFIALPGALIWLAFLLIVSVRMIRSPEANL